MLFYTTTVLSVVLFSLVKGDMEKPGNCYTMTGVANCKTTCSNDWDCSGLAKCCSASYGNVLCGRSCQEPCIKSCEFQVCSNGNECTMDNGCAVCVTSQNGNSQNGNKDKSGKCAPWIGAPVCQTNCAGDNDCSGNQKCCPLGSCGKLCQDPCKTSCESLPPCLSGKECSVVNGCAQCLPEKRKKVS